MDIKLIGYLYKKAFTNRLKKAIKKPSTYIVGIFIILYFLMLLFSLPMTLEMMKLDSNRGLVLTIFVVSLFFTPLVYFNYSRRKGLVFQPSDVHFIFTAPVSPKSVLVYAEVRQLLMSLVFSTIFFVAGLTLYKISVGKMLLFFVANYLVENLLQMGILIIFYGNEKISDTVIKIFRAIIIVMSALIFSVGLYILYTKGVSLPVALEYIYTPYIQLVPIFGWNISLVQLILTGPTLFNVMGSILYLLFVAGICAIAYKMTCKGEYYEDAMKFAEDYKIQREKGKKGEVFFPNWKKKYRVANVNYKGFYGKSIFYRQILEYKKNNTFIFGPMTLMALIVGIGFSIFVLKNPITAAQRIYMLPGLMAYITFLFSGYATKWEKELENPYIYLLPDTAIKKVWYSTLIEHIRALIDGTLLAVPGAIALKLTPVDTIAIIIIYVCLRANKLYLNMLCKRLVGKSMGSFVVNLLKLLFQGISMGIGFASALIFGMFVGVEAGFIALIVSMVTISSVSMILSAHMFNKIDFAE